MESSPPAPPSHFNSMGYSIFGESFHHFLLCFGPQGSPQASAFLCASPEGQIPVLCGLEAGSLPLCQMRWIILLSRIWWRLNEMWQSWPDIPNGHTHTHTHTHTHVCAQSHSNNYVWLSVTPWTVGCQAPLSKGFSRQEYWSGLPCPPPRIKPESLASPALAGRFFTTAPAGKDRTLLS